MILDYLDKQNLLHQINVTMSTNGTYVNDETIELLKKCRYINLYLSIDGIGDLFNYIRYGDATFEKVEPTIAKLNEIPLINIEISTAVMNYNIYRLIDIRDWVLEMSKKYSKINPRCGFSNCVSHPTYLSLRTLSDKTRKYLIDYYTKNTRIKYEFGEVIKTLSSGYSGDKIHNFWLDYTTLMQTVRKNDILKIVPELKKDFVYINRDY